MYPNKPTRRYLDMMIRARRVAAIAIMALTVSVIINIGYAKSVKDADEAVMYYRCSASDAYEKVDSLQHQIDQMECDKWFAENMCNE